jgi:hypothetical protein
MDITDITDITVKKNTTDITVIKASVDIAVCVMEITVVSVPSQASGTHGQDSTQAITNITIFKVVMDITEIMTPKDQSHPE